LPGNIYNENKIEAVNCHNDDLNRYLGYRSRRQAETIFVGLYPHVDSPQDPKRVSLVLTSFMVDEVGRKSSLETCASSTLLRTGA
jgi:hypothetical protein